MTNKKTTLPEATRYKRETGLTLPRWQDQIIKYEKQGGYFIHFSNVPRIGLYIVNKYNTPIGFYAYPLKETKMEDFAVNRPYAIIFKPKPEAKILELKKYSGTDYQSDIDKLVEMGNSLEVIEKAAKAAKNKTPGGKIWNVTRVLSDSSKIVDKSKIFGGKKEEVTRGGGPTGKWSMLLKNLGYDGVNDDCLSIIHESEPCQAVFFNTAILDLVKIIKLTSGVEGKEELFDKEERDYQRNYNLAKKSSPKLLASIAQDSDWRIRLAVAENPKTPPEVLRSLAFDTAMVRSAVASNSSTPQDVLARLARDIEYIVREAVAANPEASPEVIRILADVDNGDTSIHRKITLHPKITPEILEYLGENSKNMSVQGAVAENSLTPPATLAKLAAVEFCRPNIARNPSTSQEVLRKLADPSTENDPEIREAVADNPKVSQEILEILAKDPVNYVRHAAFQRLSGKVSFTEALIMEKLLWKLLKRNL